MDVIFVNDKNEYNGRYRSHLINYFAKAKYNCISVGVFDNKLSFIKIIFLSFLRKNYFISSNLKANIFFMILFWKKGTIILNGLGRIRSKFWFRRILLKLFDISKNKQIIIQNYADYRYFSRYVDKQFYWVPGSGGEERIIGKSDDNFIVISRNDKLSKNLLSIESFLNLKPNLYSCTLVGCTKEIISPHSEKYISTGYLDQKDIFKYSSIFFQPDGYGEGIPHSFVDALVSGMTIFMSKKNYVCFGLYKLKINYEKIANNKWIQLNYDSNHMKTLSHANISSLYFGYMKDLII